MRLRFGLGTFVLLLTVWAHAQTAPPSEPIPGSKQDLRPQSRLVYPEGPAIAARMLLTPWDEATGIAPIYPTDCSNFNPAFGGLPTLRAPNAGPASGVTADLATGEEEYLPPQDLDVRYDTARDAVFQRSFRSGRAQHAYGSPGLPVGWVHNFDIVVSNPSPSWGALNLVYPNGSSESLRPELDSQGRPTGILVVPDDRHYSATGIPSAKVTGRWESIAITWHSDVTWQFEAISDSRCALSRIHDLKLLWDASRRLQSAVTAGGKVLLTFSYDAKGFLTSVVDAQQHGVGYKIGSPSDQSENSIPCLKSVSFFTGQAQNDGYVRRSFEYVLRNNLPELGTISVFSGLRHGMAVEAIETGEDGKVRGFVDPDDDRKTFRAIPGGIEIDTIAATYYEAVIQKIDAFGRSTGLTYMTPEETGRALSNMRDAHGATSGSATFPTSYKPQPETWRVRGYAFTKIAETHLLSRADTALPSASASVMAADNVVQPESQPVYWNLSPFERFEDVGIDSTGRVSFRATVVHDPFNFQLERTGIYSGSGSLLETNLVRCSDRDARAFLLDPFFMIEKAHPDMGRAHGALFAANGLRKAGLLYYATNGTITPIASLPTDPLGSLTNIRDFSQSSSGALAFVGTLLGTRNTSNLESVYVCTNGKLANVSASLGRAARNAGIVPRINDHGTVAFQVQVSDITGKSEDQVYVTSPPYDTLRRVVALPDVSYFPVLLLQVGSDDCVYYATRDADMSFTIHRFAEGKTEDLSHVPGVVSHNVSLSIAPSGKMVCFASPGLSQDGTQHGSSETALYDGPDWANDVILRTGDSLFGKSVVKVEPIDCDGINAAGQIAAQVSLSDGRTLIVRADPIRGEHLAATGAPVPPNTEPLKIPPDVRAAVAPPASRIAMASLPPMTIPSSTGQGGRQQLSTGPDATARELAMLPKSRDTQRLKYKFTIIAVAGNPRIIPPTGNRSQQSARAVGLESGRSAQAPPTPFWWFGSYHLNDKGTAAFSAILKNSPPNYNRFVGIFRDGVHGFMRALPADLAAKATPLAGNGESSNFSLAANDDLVFFGSLPTRGVGIITANATKADFIASVRGTPPLPIGGVEGAPIINEAGVLTFRGTYTESSRQTLSSEFFVWKSGKLVQLTKGLLRGPDALIDEPIVNANGLVAFAMNLGEVHEDGSHRGRTRYRVYSYEIGTGALTMLAQEDEVLSGGGVHVIQVTEDGTVYYSSAPWQGHFDFYSVNGRQTRKLTIGNPSLDLKGIGVSPSGKTVYFGTEHTDQATPLKTLMTGLYTGADLQKDVIIHAGDTLLGQTVVYVGDTRNPRMSVSDEINDRGQVLFVAVFANGQQALVRADPLKGVDSKVAEGNTPDWSGLVPRQLPVRGFDPRTIRPGNMASSEAAHAALPIWTSPLDLASSLSPMERIGGTYSFQAPLGFTKLRAVGSNNVRSDTWIGQRRLDASYPYISISESIVNAEDMGPDALSEAVAKLLATTKRQCTLWKQSALEEGLINGEHFMRVYWAGTVTANGWKMHGMFYVQVNGSEMLELSGVDREPDSATTLPLLEASLLTYRGRFSMPAGRRLEERR